MSASRQTLVLALFAGVFAVIEPPAHAKPPKVTSVGSNGGFANMSCISTLIAGDGRYVAFESNATNLSADDTSASRTVFLRDHEKGSTEVVSLRDDDSPIAATSILEGISKNGRYVLFSTAELGVDSNALSSSKQAYLRDTKTGTTRNVSLDHEGNAVGGTVQYAALSPNARYIVFVTSAPFVVDGIANGFEQVYWSDRVTGAVECVSFDHLGNVGTGDCEFPAVSANGRYVFFQSDSLGMTADDTNNERDVFVRDRESGTTHLVSKGEAGAIAEGASYFRISASGKRVAFVSSGAVVGGISVVDGLYVHDWKSGVVQTAFSSPSHHTIAVSAVVGGVAFSANGKRLVVVTPDNLIPSQSGTISDVYLVTPDSGKVKLVTRGENGGMADDDAHRCAISADGVYVSFTSVATNLVEPGAPADIDQVYRQKL